MERYTWSNIQIMESKAHEIYQAYIMKIILWGNTLWGTFQYVIQYMKQET